MKVKDLAIVALFVALAFVLSNVRLYGSIAFDSVPAFLALLLWKDYKAGLIGGLGHIFTATLSGFPFGQITHALITILMFVMLIIAAKMIKKWSVVVTFIFIYICNALLMPFTIFVMTPFDINAYLLLVLMLTLALIGNFIVTFVLYKPTKAVLNRVENNN